MALNVYSMEMTDKIYRGMGEFVDFLYAQPDPREGRP